MSADRLNYYVSGGFYDQDGIAQNSTFRRYNIRTNADVKASKWFAVCWMPMQIQNLF